MVSFDRTTDVPVYQKLPECYTEKVYNIQQGIIQLQNKKTSVSAEELEEKLEKLEKQRVALDAYREELKTLHEYKMERDLYSELSNIFARAENIDDVFKKTLETISVHLKARYYGVFWLDEQNDIFSYRIGKGYNGNLMKCVPCKQSMMGECLYKNDVLWEQKFSGRSDYFKLNQDPEEYNVLCAPLVLLGKNAGVVRVANIDPVFTRKVVGIMQTVVRLLCSSLERLMFQQQSESTLRSLDASFSIARLLENTLNKKEILRQVCSQVHNLFKCAGCIIVMRDKENNVTEMISWPENYYMTGNKVSGTIYLRNLLDHYLSGFCIIPNIHIEKRFLAWSDPTVQSICMVPVETRESAGGVIIAVGPVGETYTATQAKLLGIVASQTSMTLERASYFALQEDLARYDGLTGLFNRRMFQNIISEEYNRVKRYKGIVSLVMFDIDHFKKINDTHGHQVGDDVIKMVTRTIKDMIRTTDRACRYGGEEFAVLLPETTSENGRNLAERIRTQIESNRSVNGLSVTVSCGISEYTVLDTIESIIKRADTALYNAKENGRNRVVLG